MNHVTVTLLHAVLAPVRFYDRSNTFTYNKATVCSSNPKSDALAPALRVGRVTVYSNRRIHFLARSFTK